MDRITQIKQQIEQKQKIIPFLTGTALTEHYDAIRELTLELATLETKPTGELTGGRVNYYLASVNNPQREDQPGYIAECEDIIQALDMTFDEGCLFKALWRTASARLGNGKPGQKALYDAEKMVHYAGRILTKAKHEEPK